MDDGRDDLSALALAAIVVLSVLLSFATCLRQSEFVMPSAFPRPFCEPKRERGVPTDQHDLRSAAVVSYFAAVTPPTAIRSTLGSAWCRAPFF
jgi:hypothetical protein